MTEHWEGSVVPGERPGRQGLPSSSKVTIDPKSPTKSFGGWPQSCIWKISTFFFFFFIFYKSQCQWYLCPILQTTTWELLAWNTLPTHPHFARNYKKLTFCMSSRIVSNLLFFTSWLSDSDSFSNSAHTWSINVFCMLNLSNSAGSSFERFSSNHAGYYTYI